MASSLDHPVHTFSGKFSEGELYDESYYSDIVSNRFGTEHRTVVPDAGGFQEHMPKLIWHMDEPAVGAGVFPQYMVCRLARENGVVVVNGGQGGDELFAGYPKYLEPRQGRLKTRMRRGMTFQAGLTRRFRQSAGPVSPLPSVLDDPLANEMYNDLRLYLAALLHVEDRTSMAVSLESRTPFIDYRLVELASSISTMQKMSGGLKSLLIQAMADVLPNEIVERRDKKGFPTPIGVWFRGELRGWLREKLLHPDSGCRYVYRTDFLRLALAAHDLGPDMSSILWPALNIALWFEQFRAGVDW
jgi:asparagine synthase (glutamine-hydrolysing)